MSLNNAAARAGHCPDDENDEEAGLHYLTNHAPGSAATGYGCADTLSHNQPCLCASCDWTLTALSYSGWAECTGRC